MKSIKPGERSFTLVETVIALGLMVFLIAQFVGVQAGAVSAADYGRKIAQATWLAKRVMSQVEYFATTKKWTELSTGPSEKDHPFEDFPDYKYDLEIKEWKLPILSLLGQTLGGAGKTKEENESKDDAKSSSPYDGMLKQILGEDLLKIAHVEVFWTEGAARESVSLTYLLVNQSKIDEAILMSKAIAEAGGVPQGTSPAPGASPNPQGSMPSINPGGPPP